MSTEARNPRVEELFGPPLPGLPRDPHLLRQLHEKTDAIIGELRLGMANASDAEQWWAENRHKVPIPAPPPRLWSFVNDAAGGQPRARAGLADVLAYLPHDAVAHYTNAGERNDYKHSQELLIAALERLRTRINASLNAMATGTRAEATDIGPIPAADLLTTDQLAELALVTKKTLQNKLADARKRTRLPEPLRDRGNSPDRYSYAAIRPFLLETWPAKEMRFPTDFSQVKQILAGD